VEGFTRYFTCWNA